MTSHGIRGWRSMRRTGPSMLVEAVAVVAAMAAVAAVSAAAVLAAGPAAETAQAGAVAAAAKAAPAAETEVVIEIEAVDAEGLAGYDATLLFAATVVRLTDIVAGEFLPEGSDQVGPLELAEGEVEIGSWNEAGNTVIGSGTLAVARFEVLGDGPSRIRLGGRPDANVLFGAAGVPLEPPARLRLVGVPPPGIFLPWATR